MRFVAAINVLLWGAFIWIGHRLLDASTARDVAGYPNAGQVMYYLYCPIAMVILALAAYGLSRFRKLWYIGLGIEVLLLFFFFPFLLRYTGGV